MVSCGLCSVSMQKVIENQKNKLRVIKENAKKYSIKDFLVVKKLG